jgi:hypothetical protein
MCFSLVRIPGASFAATNGRSSISILSSFAEIEKVSGNFDQPLHLQLG